MTIVTGFWSYD